VTALKSSNGVPIVRGKAESDSDHLFFDCDFVLMQGIEHGSMRGF
jgi:hypothetical protein